VGGTVDESSSPNPVPRTVTRVSAGFKEARRKDDNQATLASGRTDDRTDVGPAGWPCGVMDMRAYREQDVCRAAKEGTSEDVRRDGRTHTDGTGRTHTDGTGRTHG